MLGDARVRCTRCSDNLWRFAYLFVTCTLRALLHTYALFLSSSLCPSISPFWCVRHPLHVSPRSQPPLVAPSRLPKSRQHLACSILGKIQADILSRAITVTFDHRMTGEWLTLRHQSMNFSLSAWYNLQSAQQRPSRQLSPHSRGTPPRHPPLSLSPFLSLSLSRSLSHSLIIRIIAFAMSIV